MSGLNIIHLIMYLIWLQVNPSNSSVVTLLYCAYCNLTFLLDKESKF